MEPIGATASILGIAEFGLGLAKNLQTYIESVIEAEETIALVVAEVTSTASTLKDLQQFIDQDRAASKEEHRATVFSTTGIKDVRACALQCQRLYSEIIAVVKKVSMQVGGKDAGPQSPAADDLNTFKLRLAVLSKNITKLSRKMWWPWLEPRIKQCQEHLGRLKASLMLRLLVVSIAATRVRPSVTRIFGTDDENEMRRKAEALLDILKEIRTKTSSAKQSTRQPPESKNGASAGADATSNTSGASTASVDTSSSSQNLPVPSASSSSSSMISNPMQEPRRARRLRVSRARRIWNSFKVHVRKRTERKSVFKKDSRSVIFEAYLIYPIPGPFSGDSYPPPIKLPFGHRRLTHEIKHALRKFNPWDILLILSPHHRYLVDRVVQRVQSAATGTSHVCLVAIDVDGGVDVDGYSDADISCLEAGDLVWTRMVLFFRHEPVHTRQRTTETGLDLIGGRPRIETTGGNIFLRSWWKSKKRLELQERLKRGQEEETRAEKERQQQELKEKVEAEIARRDAETRAHNRKLEFEREQRRREMAQEHMRRQREREYRQRPHEAYIKSEVAGRLQRLEEERLREERRPDQEEEEAERREQEFKDRIEAKIIKREAARQDRHEKEHRSQQQQEKHNRKVAIEASLEDVQKGISAGEAMMSEETRVEMKEDEEKAAAEKAISPITLKDAIGRKFSFPFHLVQTWEGMEGLIKQAFLHVDVIGSQVQEGKFDLMDSEGQIILPSLWSVIIKPGQAVSMCMWPANEAGRPPQPAAPFPGKALQGDPTTPGMPSGMGQKFEPHPRPFVPHLLSPHGEGATPPHMVEKLEGGRPKKAEARRAKRTQLSFRDSEPSKKSGNDKHKHSKPKNVEVHDDDDSEVTDKDEGLGNIDVGLGLDDLEEAEEVAAKNIDELLETWTNVGGEA